jgi:hypothetical protein
VDVATATSTCRGYLFIRAGHTVRMDSFIVGIVIALVLVLLCVASVVYLLVTARRRRRERDRHDDTRRAGPGEPGNPADAANRASGTNSWMRPGSGGF